jgi:hypothetical protein
VLVLSETVLVLDRSGPVNYEYEYEYEYEDEDEYEYRSKVGHRDALLQHELNF